MKRDILLWANIVVSLTKSEKYNAKNDHEIYNLRLLEQGKYIKNSYNNVWILTNRGQELAAYASTQVFAETHAFLLSRIGAAPFDLFMSEVRRRVRLMIKED